MSKAAKRKFEVSASDPHKQLLSFFKAFGHRHSMHEVFSDFVELSALAISNAVDRHQFDAREQRYLEQRRTVRVGREHFHCEDQHDE